MYPLLPAGPSVDLAEAFGTRRGVRLRLYVMLAGFLYLESMLALLHLHPDVHVDVGVLHALFAVPERPIIGIYARWRRTALPSGSCSGPTLIFANQAAPGINAILTADFLNTEQKADVPGRNAQRFLRLMSANGVAFVRHHALRPTAALPSTAKGPAGRVEAWPDARKEPHEDHWSDLARRAGKARLSQTARAKSEGRHPPNPLRSIWADGRQGRGHGR
jgi:hypothetical protein